MLRREGEGCGVRCEGGTGVEESDGCNDGNILPSLVASKWVKCPLRCAAE